MLKKISIRNFSVSDEPCRMDMLDVIPVSGFSKKNGPGCKTNPESNQQPYCRLGKQPGKNVFFSFCIHPDRSLSDCRNSR